MKIDIENCYKENIVPDYETIIRKVIERALDYEECPYETQVYVLLTDNEEIHQVNLEHRQIDRPTDVLSFPMVSYTQPADFSDVEERDPDAFHPETGELLLGDILISMDKVQEQAEEYGHSLQRELAFLVAHSMLHLMGYDHMEDGERQIMERKQEEILKQCGYVREG
ncbi:MAG: rRNA maturation RNase YbeY [Clostridiales bacterium]|nr:rRNA maturation RNase YbeY [Clostridiales bacterium]